MKLIKIPDSDIYIMASDIKLVKLYTPGSNDFAIDITTNDGMTKSYWLSVKDKQEAQQMIAKFIEDFNNL